MINEGLARIELPKQTSKISKEQVVFYNPVMRVNRDISVLVVKSSESTSCALPMAASGIRGIRFLLETNSSEVYMNDLSLDSLKIIEKNCKLNDVSCSLENLDANEFLLSHPGFSYIDIDPFGSPNVFLQAAILRISRGGILAVTATDTAPLCGTYPKTCVRKYWAKPIRNEIMHEAGLRILIRKIQMVASQFDKALVPVLSYYKDHYFRIFFKCFKGKKKCDELYKFHEELFFDVQTGKVNSSSGEKYGPLWTGELIDSSFIEKIMSNIDDNISEETKKFLSKLQDEAPLSSKLIYDLHFLAKRNGFKIPRTTEIIAFLNKKGFKTSGTHINSHSIRTDASFKDLSSIIKNWK